MVLLCLVLSGYIVFSGVRRSNGVQGLRVIVQSDRTLEFVESRIEAFLLKMQVIVCGGHPLQHMGTCMCAFLVFFVCVLNPLNDHSLFS